MASKNGCLICNACNHSHSPTLHGSTILSIFRLSFLMDIFFFSPPCSMKSTVTKNIFTISELKVSRINYDSLRYFAGASSATAPPTCRATMIRDCIDVHHAFTIDSIRIYPLLYPHRTIANRSFFGTPRCMNSLLSFSPSFLLLWLFAYRTVSCEPDMVSL